MPNVDFEVIPVLDTPIGITSSKLTNTDGSPKWIGRVLLAVEDAAIRMTLIKGTNPSNASKIGAVISAGTIININDEQDIINLRMIRAGAGAASVYVELGADDGV